MNNLDSRTHAFDSAAQLADVALQGRLDGQGWKWVTPRPVVAARRLSLKASPDELAAQVTEALPGDADLVLLAGFMRILTPAFVDRFAGRLLNIHPSLLPKYPGLHTHQRAIDAGDAEAGATVHLVTADLDAGPILGQARVPVLPGDTAGSLAARVLEQEHRLYPEVLRRFALGQQGMVTLGAA